MEFGWSDLAYTIGLTFRGAVAVTLAIFMYYAFLHGPLKKILQLILRKGEKNEEYKTFDKDEPDIQEKIEVKQSDLEEKSIDFHERITKPREEKKKLEAEEKLYKFQKLHQIPFRGEGQELDPEHSGDENEDSAVRRRFPQNVLEQERIIFEQRQQERDERRNKPQPPTLPEVQEEPDADEEGTVTLGFRTISPCRVVKRRFYITDTHANLLAYMRKIGYTHVIYQLVQPFPRRELNDPWGTTLEELGLTKQSMLNIEARE